jgi:hypothetical protein
MSARTSSTGMADYISQAAYLQGSFRSSRASLEAIEMQKTAIVVSLGNSIRRIDDMLARLNTFNEHDHSDLAKLIAQLQEARADAVSIIAAHLPDEAFLWTTDMQAAIRESEADVAAGRTHIFTSDADFDAFLQEQRADV